MNNKIKALLLLKGKNLTKYAEFTNRSQSNISNKVSRSSWNIYDLIQLADFTDTKLAFIDENDKPVMIFDKSDIKSK